MVAKEAQVVRKSKKFAKGKKLETTKPLATDYYLLIKT